MRNAVLVAWSLSLMQKAFDYQEFSFMLAGILVAFCAVAMLFVYFLMGNCLHHFQRILH